MLICWQGFIHPKAFIATQLPLPQTIVDIWRLVYECNCSCIIKLEEPESDDVVSFFNGNLVRMIWHNCPFEAKYEQLGDNSIDPNCVQHHARCPSRHVLFLGDVHVLAYGRSVLGSRHNPHATDLNNALKPVVGHFEKKFQTWMCSEFVLRAHLYTGQLIRTNQSSYNSLLWHYWKRRKWKMGYRTWRNSKSYFMKW